MNVLDAQKERLSNEDKAVLLGRLMWYSVSEDTMIDHTTMIQELQKVGLSGKAVPHYPRDHNIFRRVTGNAQKKRVPVAGTDLFENWMIRDVAGRAEQIITRRIVVETVDQKGKRLDYAQVADIEFDRNISKIRFSWMDGNNETTYPEAQQIMSGVASEFHRWRGKLNHYALREWIRLTILNMGATAVRPAGGVYFLEEQYAEQVEALEEFVAALPGTNECHSLPLIDDAKQRQMLHRAIEAETSGAIDDLLTEIRTIQQNGKLTPRKFSEILGEQKTLRTKTAAYAKLLERELGGINSRLDLLQRTSMSLAHLQKKRGSK